MTLQVYQDLSTRRLLVSEWVDGIKLTQAPPEEVRDACVYHRVPSMHGAGRSRTCTCWLMDSLNAPTPPTNKTPKHIKTTDPPRHQDRPGGLPAAAARVRLHARGPPPGAFSMHVQVYASGVVWTRAVVWTQT